MTFFIIFICFGAELMWFSFAPLRASGWVSTWTAWLTRTLELRRWLGNGAPLVAVALPALVVAYFFDSVVGDSTLLSIICGCGVLLFCSGPRDVAGEIEFYKRNYVDHDDDALPLEPENFLNQVTAVVGDPDRPYETAVAVAANDGLFAPMFWFAILGPVGPVVFRMASVLRDDAGLTAGESAIARRLYDIALWLPARALAFGLGLAGTLAPVFAVFGKGGFGLAHSADFLGEAALAALGSHRDDALADDDEHLGAIHAMFGLIKRGFAVWLVILALLVAAGIV